MWPQPQTSPTGGSSKLPDSLRLCVRKNVSAPSRGHLSDEPRVESLLQALLVFGPAVWLLVGAAFRIVQLRRAKIVVVPNRRGYPKLVATLTLFGLQLAYLVFGIREHSSSWDALTARVLGLATAAVVGVLSLLEHGRNVGPSALLTTYLVLVTFSDAVQIALLAVAWNLCSPWGLASAIFAARFVLLVLEVQTKRSILREPYAKLSPEQTAGFLGVAFFWWVNDILRKGYHKMLTLDDLPRLDESLDAMKAREMMQESWDKRSNDSHIYPLPSRLYRQCVLTGAFQKSQKADSPLAGRY